MRFVWSDCELDREARVLRRAGEPVRVQPLVLDLLLLLVQQRGRVVSEERLRASLWPDTRVTDASLRRLLKETRRAIGDDGERQAQIQTVRGRGIRFGAAVETRDGWDTSFVGRSDDLARLERRLEEASSGLGGVTLLRGPAGMGKTRTLAELQGRADLAGFRVLHGSGRSGAQEDAFHPWMEAARELGVVELSSGSEALLDTDRRGTAEARRFATFRAVLQAIAREARAQPLLIALDDVHLADPDSLELLRFLAPAIARAPAWIVAAYRTSAAGSTPQLRSLAALDAETSTQSLELRGLAAGELRALVQSRARAPVGERFAALIAERTGGNPLFALEIAGSAQRDGRSLEAEPTAELEAALPLDIEPLLERRIAVIAPETRAILRAAAALGTEFDTATLLAAERASERTLARALREAEAAGLVESLDGGRARFSHPLLGEALYRRLASDPAARAQQHLRIAEAMEALGISDPFALARHFAAARPGASAARVLPFAVAAAREAFRRTAFADAEHWYGVALALGEEAEVSAEERADLYFELGDVVAASGGLVRPRDYYDRASRLAKSVGDRRRMALAALGFAHHPQGFGSADPGTVSRLREVEALPSGDRALDARVSSRLGAELLEAGERNAEEAEAKLASSLAAARELGEPYTLGRVLLNIANVRFSAPDVAAWMVLARESAAHARVAADFDTEFRARQFCVAAMLQLGDREQCDAELAACQRIAREHPTRYTRIATRTMEAMFALLDGRIDEARAAVDEADGTESAKEGLGVAARITAVRFWLGLEAGAAAEPSFDSSTPSQISSHPVLIASAALARALGGDLPESERALAAFVAALPRLPYDRSRLPALALAAEVAFRVRAPEAARVLQPHVEPFAHLGAVLATASVYVGSMAQALGWIAAAQGRTEEAVEHFRRALRVHEALRSASWVRKSTRAIAEVNRAAVAARAGSRPGRRRRAT